MLPIFHRSTVPLSLAAVLATCAGTILFSTTGFAQTKRAPTKPRPARIAGSNTAPQEKKTATVSEPELQLEPLPTDPSVENADVSITAHVRARSLKFDVVPNPTVEFPGQPARDTVWEAVRENLPTPVEPGVTYRNIGIRLKITSVFHDIDRIVAEALGEVPVTDDATPVQPPVQPAQENKPSTTPTTAPRNPQPASTPPPLRERP